MTAVLPTVVPGYLTGTWDIDPVHSSVGFSVRHLMVSRVRGWFREFSGTIVTAEDPTRSQVAATIETGSIDTGHPKRDADLRSGTFLFVEHYPQMSFRSTAVRTDGAAWFVEGELSLKGCTRPVVLSVEPGGFGPDPYGGTRAGFSARTQISRSEFEVDVHLPLDGGGMVIGDTISVELEIEAVLRPA